MILKMLFIPKFTWQNIKTMKKTVAYFVATLIICLIAKKTVAAEITDSTRYFEGRIRDYIAEKIKKVSPSDTIKIKEVLSKIDFSGMRKEKFPQEGEFSFGDMYILLVPVKGINVHDFIGNRERIVTKSDSADYTPGLYNTVIKAVFIIQAEQSKIFEGSIIEISSPNYSTADIEKNFTDIIRVKLKDFTGHLNNNHLSQRLNNDWGYKNGVVISSTVLAFKQANSSNEENKSKIDWYLETTYFGTGTIKNKDSKYLYSVSKESLNLNF